MIQYVYQIIQNELHTLLLQIKGATGCTIYVYQLYKLLRVA